MRSIELFSGAGGLALGLHFAGFQHDLLVESDKDAVGTLRTNIAARTLAGIHGWNVEHTRVEDMLAAGDLDRGDIDLLAAGIPCQPFSRAGSHRMHDDHRNMLPVFARVLHRMRPKAFVLENVDGLVRANEANEYIKMQLEYPEISRATEEPYSSYTRRLTAHKSTTNSAYSVHMAVLNAADFGVPQLRKRVFLVGFRSDLTVQWNFPAPAFSNEALVQNQWVTGEYWRKYNILPNKQLAPSLSLLSRATDCTDSLPWYTLRDMVSVMPSPTWRGVGLKDWQGHVRIPGARLYPGHTGSEIDRPSKTIKAGEHGVTGGENILVYPNRRFR